jgi:hypothetical protein
MTGVGLGGVRTRKDDKRRKSEAESVTLRGVEGVLLELEPATRVRKDNN